MNVIIYVVQFSGERTKASVLYMHMTSDHVVTVDSLGALVFLFPFQRNSRIFDVFQRQRQPTKLNESFRSLGWYIADFALLNSLII